jgi:hypothetical protein
MCQALHPKRRAVASVPPPAAVLPENLLNHHDPNSNCNNNKDKDEDDPDDDNEDNDDIDDINNVIHSRTGAAMYGNDKNNEDGNNDDDNDNNNDDNNDGNDVKIDVFNIMNACQIHHPHANRLVIDIAGIAAGDLGCQCREHKVCCGMVVDVDIVVHLHHMKILVPHVFLGKNHIREETAITLNWVTNGFECCRVGFLPLPYVPDAALYDGALCQVIEVFDKDDPSHKNWAKWKKLMGLRVRW